MIELQSAHVEADQTALYITGNLENGESVNVAMLLDNLKEVCIETACNQTYITLQWREKREGK